MFSDWQQRVDFATALAALLEAGAQQQAATWLLKRAIESGALAPAQLEQGTLNSLDRLVEPEAKLHVLQVLDKLRIGRGQRRAVERFVYDCLASPHKFVSAWAYSGLHALASQYPEYRADADAILAVGLRDGPPSTRARIRRLLKQGFPV